MNVLALIRIVVPALVLGGLGYIAYDWHSDQVQGFQDQLLAEQTKARNTAAVRGMEAHIELKNQLDASQAKYAADMADAGRRIAAAAGDPRVRESERANFATRLATATADQARASAEACDGNYERSRTHIVRFGREAAECSAIAHKQARDIEAVDTHWTRYQDALKGLTK
jgi:hypothetical protein